jgi:hypothetical protein
MEMNYETIEKWIQDYFHTYSTYGQKPETADKMKDFFAPDLRFIPYIAKMGGPEGGFHSRDEFLSRAVTHSKWYERLTPLQICIDERRQCFSTVFGMEVVDTRTEEVTIRKHGTAHYNLVLDENQTIKIKEIHFFWEVMPPDFKEFYQVYAND